MENLCTQLIGVHSNSSPNHPNPFYLLSSSPNLFPSVIFFHGQSSTHSAILPLRRSSTYTEQKERKQRLKSKHPLRATQVKRQKQSSGVYISIYIASIDSAAYSCRRRPWQCRFYGQHRRGSGNGPNINHTLLEFNASCLTTIMLPWLLEHPLLLSPLVASSSTSTILFLSHRSATTTNHLTTKHPLRNGRKVGSHGYRCGQVL